MYLLFFYLQLNTSIAIVKIMDFIRCSNCKAEKQRDNFATYMRHGIQQYRLTCKQCLVYLQYIAKVYMLIYYIYRQKVGKGDNSSGNEG